MRRLTSLICMALVSLSTSSYGQTKRPAPAPARRPAPPPPKPTTMIPEIKCPTPLGVGVTSKRNYCDVMSGREPESGILIPLPVHRGPLTLTFDLYNRHTYSQETNKAFARYTATIGVLTMDNTLISRAVVQNEYRGVENLIERIGGGAGPTSLKAVAPTGAEHIIISVPQEEEQVSLLGEKLTVETRDGTANYTSPGRAIAIISNVSIEYVAGAPPRSTAKPATAKPATSKPTTAPPASAPPASTRPPTR